MTLAPLLSLEPYSALSAAERRRLASELAEQLGVSWQPARSSHARRFVLLRNSDLNLDFVAVTGGEYLRGLSEVDEQAAAEHVDLTAAVRQTLDELALSARPVHALHVRPFLVTREPLSEAALIELTEGGYRRASFGVGEARSLAERLGLRLISEAEYEWLARDGGRFSFTLDLANQRKSIGRDDRKLPSRFGVTGLFGEHWTADDWHDSYLGAPSTSNPWYEGGETTVYRGGFLLAGMQSTEELLWALAAVRQARRTTSSIPVTRLVMPINVE